MPLTPFEKLTQLKKHKIPKIFFPQLYYEVI